MIYSRVPFNAAESSKQSVPVVPTDNVYHVCFSQSAEIRDYRCYLQSIFIYLRKKKEVLARSSPLLSPRHL